MFVHVDLTQDPPARLLLEPENFTAFKLTSHGGELPELAAALGDLGDVDADGAHVWLTIAALRSLAGDLASQPGWSKSFDGMIRYAGSKGWLSENGEAIRAHVERV